MNDNTPTTIYLRLENDNYVKLSNYDKALFHITKVRGNAWVCRVCDKKISAKSYCFGSGYRKLCLNCAEKFLVSAVKGFKGYSDFTKQILKSLNKNRENYNNLNMLAEIENGNGGK